MLRGVAFDPENEMLRYQWSQTSGQPTVVLSGATSSVATFTSPSGLAEAAVLMFALRATDERGLATTARVAVRVELGTNTPPVVDAGSDQVVDEGAEVTLRGSATDAEGGVLSYRWEQIGGGDVVLGSPTSSVATFTAPEQLAETATLVFRLTVTDRRDASSSAEVSVEVLPGENDAPT